MDPGTLAIPLAFILLAAVLCLLLIGSKWKWWQKLALIVIVPSFGLVVWSAIASYKGWPTTSDPPKKSLIFWMLIREPDPAHGDKGGIYLWLLPIDEKASPSVNPLDYSSPAGEPRAYKLPYSRSMHAGLDRAKALMREGQPVVLDFDGKNGSNGAEGEGGEPGDGTGVGTDDGTDGPNGSGRPGYGGDPNRRDFRIYQLPPPQPPRKIPEH
jgi:hypothetical protein